MRRRGKRTRGKRIWTRRDERTIDVVTQLEVAVGNPLAATLGAAIGGIVPWFGREIAHGELATRWYADPKLIVVAGCVLFSVATVYAFGRAAFGSPRKAAGFVAALEGVMLISHGWIGVVALCVLIAINAIANGCTIALARDATRRRREADARRSATRARRRGVGPRQGGGDLRPTTPSATHEPSRRPAQARDGMLHRPRWFAVDETATDAEIVDDWSFS
jgi:hypothetical protein